MPGSEAIDSVSGAALDFENILRIKGAQLTT
jgi:hypothetical protein